jgi:AhpD family alkylhydroperoxidase
MKQRINVHETGGDALAAMYGLGKYLSKSTIDQELLHLLYFRVSQINGCAFCLDMHSKDLMHKGESDQRLFLISTWRETSFFTEKEKAALAWAEELTKLNFSLVPDEIYEEASKHFTAEEMIELTMAVITINSYNRINIAFGAPVGTYQVGQFKIS